MVHDILTKDELESLINPLPGDTQAVTDLVDNNGQNIYAIYYNYYSKKVICFIASEVTGVASLKKHMNLGKRITLLMITHI